MLERMAKGEAAEYAPVQSVTLGPDAYYEEHDAIDFTKATHSLLPASALFASNYLPEVPDEWNENVRRRSDANGGALVSKIRRADARILARLRNASRLGSIIQTCWRRKKAPLVIAETLPSGVPRSEWRLELMAALGVKLGGAAALAPTGAPIWKGQNIFPGGVVGTPIAGGFWNEQVSKVPRKGLMGYATPFSYCPLYPSDPADALTPLHHRVRGFFA